MSDWTSVAAIAPAHNTDGKHDATGAFQPEARAFLALAGGEGRKVLLTFDNRRPVDQRRDEVEELIRGLGGTVRKTLCLAFFCHGWKRGLQTGHTVYNAERLAEAIASVTGPGPLVPLYACDAAGSPDDSAPGGDGGMADLLRDRLCMAGADRCRVLAHVTTGHTTRNPHVREFRGEGSPTGGTGGFYLVSPHGERWLAWKRRLWAHDDPTRLLFPWVTQEHLHRRLALGEGLA